MREVDSSADCTNRGVSWSHRTERLIDSDLSSGLEQRTTFGQLRCRVERRCLNDVVAGGLRTDRSVFHPGLADGLHATREWRTGIDQRLPQGPIPFGHLGHAGGALGLVFSHRSVDEQDVLHRPSLTSAGSGRRSPGVGVDSGWRPSAPSMYEPAELRPAARLTNAAPAISGVTGLPSWRR